MSYRSTGDASWSREEDELSRRLQHFHRFRTRIADRVNTGGVHCTIISSGVCVCVCVRVRTLRSLCWALQELQPSTGFAQLVLLINKDVEMKYLFKKLTHFSFFKPLTGIKQLSNNVCQHMCEYKYRSNVCVVTTML